MIITCPNCNKQFKIDPSLIPSEGRDLQCSSCEHVWFYNIEDKKSSPLTLNNDLINNEVEDNLEKKNIEDKAKYKKSIPIDEVKKKEKKNTEKEKPEISKIKKENAGNKFFSYLIVFIISFVALIILLDTLKTPLINVFPSIEIILFNLFETLKDIKLFIIDLS